jgi:hypothetical protein
MMREWAPTGIPAVSSIIKFFLATNDETAAGTPPGSLAGGPETVELGNFDPVGMLNDWEAAFLARDADEILDGGRPIVGGGGRILRLEGSAVLIAVSPDLVTDLAEAGEPRLAEIRSRWIQLKSLDDEKLDSVTAGELLAEVAELAVLADERRHGVYCWWY